MFWQAICLKEISLICFDFKKYVFIQAFIYVGIYGYSFMDSGKNVNDLFIANGLTMIINDNLVGSALNFMALTVSFITGGLGVLLDHHHEVWLEMFDNEYSHSAGPAFL